jgi:hypothetical protein
MHESALRHPSIGIGQLSVGKWTAPCLQALSASRVCSRAC